MGFPVAYVWFQCLKFSPEKYAKRDLTRSSAGPFISFQIKFPYHPFIGRYIDYVTEKVSLNKLQMMTMISVITVNIKFRVPY
jgi:hypothetical protein